MDKLAKQKQEHSFIYHHSYKLQHSSVYLAVVVHTCYTQTCFLQGYFRASVAFLAAAVLLCRAVPQVQLVLQSLRRPCSHSPWPGAACSAFSTSKAARGPTPQRYTADTHIHIQTHTNTHALKQGLVFIQCTS